MDEEFNSKSSQESFPWPTAFNTLWDKCAAQYMLPPDNLQNCENIPSTSGMQDINLNQMFAEDEKLPPFYEIDPMMWRNSEEERNAFTNIPVEQMMKWGSQIELESPEFVEPSKEQNTLTVDPETFFQNPKYVQPQIVASTSTAQQASTSHSLISSNLSHVQVSSSSSHAPSSLPASKSWSGEYDFAVSFSHQEKITKGISYTYSSLKDKLYVKKDAACAVNFSANRILPHDVHIRVMALYTAPEQASDIVHRCLNHSMEEIGKGVKEAEHLIRCESSAASYHVDTITGRHSVVVPFENPPVGQHYSTFIYKFACFGSCAGGPNRRPLMLIFTLEKGNQVIGRRRLDVKICACPGRDKKIEEGQLKNPELSNHQAIKRQPSESVDLSDVMNSNPPPKNTKTSPNKEVYTILMNDLTGYDFLIQLKQMYEFSQLASNTRGRSIQDSVAFMPEESD